MGLRWSISVLDLEQPHRRCAATHDGEHSAIIAMLLPPAMAALMEPSVGIGMGWSLGVLGKQGDDLGLYLATR